jgi:hypothetical protein
MIAFANWRIGVVLWMIVAVLQDPIRKVTPGTPVYLTVAFLPVYVATFASLLLSQNVLKSFAKEFSALSGLFRLLVVMLIASAMYGYAVTHKSMMASLIGIGSYAGGIPAIYCGYALLKKDYRILDLLMIGFVGLTAIMLIGVPLEYAGFKFSRPWLGTIAMTGKNYRWFNSYDYVQMISGFHRSPEIMGWHAMAMVICSFYLYLRRPSYAVIWTALATWGAYGIFLSGRRKMLLMLFVFVGTFLVFSTLRNRKRILKAVVLTLLVLIPGILFGVDDLYQMTLSSGLDTAGSKTAEKVMQGPLWLMGIVGPFGFGVGSLAQGSQHFVQLSNIPLVEGGMEKVMVEVGILGLLLVLFIALQMMILGRQSLKIGQRFLPQAVGPAFCFSYVAANFSAFLIAFQFLGDPFIGTFLGLFIGMLLSTGRLAQSQRVPIQIPMAPNQASQSALLQPLLPRRPVAPNS